MLAEVNQGLRMTADGPNLTILDGYPSIRGYFVYSLEHLETGKRYIGSCKNLHSRFTSFKWMVLNKPTTAVTQLINIYGWNAFGLTILQSNLQYKADARELEQKFIEELGTMSPNGFNRIKASKE